MGRRIIVSSIIFSMLSISCCNSKTIQSTITNNSSDFDEPSLRMPFRSGIVVLCAQGNLSPEGFSHNIERINCSFSFDFLNPTIKDLEIVAAEDGEIADIFTTALPNKDYYEGGWGWGNYVMIDHSNQYYTLYAHLNEIVVEVGQEVKSGTILGTIGKTGLAGGIDHLHFGLFRGTFNKHEGINPPIFPIQIPVEKLLTLDLDKKENEFTFHRGIAIVGIPLLFGNMYASENDVNRKPQLGKLTKSTLDSLIEKRKSLISYLKTDPFKTMKIKGDINVQKQIELIENKINTIH
jgi:hypothetical protein